MSHPPNHGPLSPSHLLFNEDHHVRLDLSTSSQFRHDRDCDGASPLLRHQAPEIAAAATLTAGATVHGVLPYELVTGHRAELENRRRGEAESRDGLVENADGFLVPPRLDACENWEMACVRVFARHVYVWRVFGARRWC